ncbi:hypothetical protein RYX36_029019 [Vicia faba]
MRKQKQIEDLTEEACRLKNENGRLKENIKATEDAYGEMEETNSVVRKQIKQVVHSSCCSCLANSPSRSFLHQNQPDDGDPLLEERKRKRMLSNSKSARRSRMSKQKQIEDLTEEAYRLKNENDRLKQNIKAAEDAYAEIEETNSVIRVQTMELSDRLLFLNLMVKMLKCYWLI